MLEMYKPILYEGFRSIVEEIKNDPKTAEYVGGGSESRVWRANQSGIDYALKIMNKLNWRDRPSNTALVARNKVELGLRALKIPGLEQLYTASPEDGVVVYDFARGINLSDMDENDFNRITNDSIKALINTVRSATEARIMFDGWNSSGGNAFYDDDIGFTLIDYREAGPELSVDANWKYAKKSLGKIGLRLNDRLLMIEEGGTLG